MLRSARRKIMSASLSDELQEKHNVSIRSVGVATVVAGCLGAGRRLLAAAAAAALCCSCCSDEGLYL